jgi:hypothetical protein
LDFVNDWSYYETRINYFIYLWFNVYRPLARSGKYIDIYEAYNQLSGVPRIDDLLDVTHSDNHKEDYFRAKIDRMKCMGRVKKYKKYMTYFVNGRLRVRRRPG